MCGIVNEVFGLLGDEKIHSRFVLIILTNAFFQPKLMIASIGKKSSKDMKSRIILKIHRKTKTLLKYSKMTTSRITLNRV